MAPTPPSPQPSRDKKPSWNPRNALFGCMGFMMLLCMVSEVAIRPTLEDDTAPIAQPSNSAVLRRAQLVERWKKIQEQQDLDDEDDGEEASETGRLSAAKADAAENSGDDVAERPSTAKTADDDDAQAPLARPKKAVDWRHTTAMVRAKLKQLEEEGEFDESGGKRREKETFGHGRQMIEEEEIHLGRTGIDESAAEDEVLRDWSAVSQAPALDEANAASENEAAPTSSLSSSLWRHGKRKRSVKEASSQAERSLLKGGHNKSERPAHGTLESMDHMTRRSANGGRQPRRAPRPLVAQANKDEDEEGEDKEGARPAPSDDAMITDRSAVGDWGAASREEHDNDEEEGHSSSGKHRSKKSGKDLKKAISQSWNAAKKEEKAKERREKRLKERSDQRLRSPDDVNNEDSEESGGQDRRAHRAHRDESEDHSPVEAADVASSRGDEEMAKMTEELQPYLDRAEKPGVNPRKDVVPLLRKAKLSTMHIKLFKRLLKARSVSLDGGPLLDSHGSPVPKRPTMAEREAAENEDSEDGDEDQEESYFQAMSHGLVLGTTSRKPKNRGSTSKDEEGEDGAGGGRPRERRQKVSPSNFAAKSHLMNGALPSAPICACVDPKKPPLKPLRWLHVPKCGTSIGITLIYYACAHVPDTLEIRVAHAGIEPSAPEGVDSDFNFKHNCLKQNAFISKSGGVGTHAGLDYSQTWDNGLSKGRTVCFFRDPKQRLISAFWHSQHADGMPKPVWGQLRESVQAIERNMSHWREKVAAIPLSQLQRDTPAAILPEYRKAFSIYFHWPGIQGCMTKMLLGYRCADDVALTPALAAKALRRLHHDLAFVGLTEEWDASVCLFHQMLGGHAREIEFLNYRAGKMTRAKPVPKHAAAGSNTAASSATTTTSESQEGPPTPPPGEKKYDVAVHEGLIDRWDEDTYEAARAAFTANVRNFATCPEQQNARISVEHILNSRKSL